MYDTGYSEFLIPNLPPPSQKKKKTNTMNWLQDDADGIFGEASSSSLPSITVIEGDFKELSQRIESTSTPCTARTLPSVFNKDTPALTNDSGICQSTSVTMSSSFNSQMCASDYASISEMYNIPRSRSNSCSSDSAFGEGSSYGHSQPLSDYSNSQISDCVLSNAASLESLESDLELLHSDINEDVSEHSKLPKCVQKDAEVVACSQPISKENYIVDESCNKCHANQTEIGIDLQHPKTVICNSRSSISNLQKLQAVQKSFLTPYNDRKFTIFLEKFSPREPDRVIGRKMGLDEIDFVAELASRDVIFEVGIFKYLEDKDLARMCCVSRSWRDSIYAEGKANKRREAFIKSFKIKKDQKENPVVKCKVNRERRGLTKSRDGACSNVQFQAEAKRPPPISPEKTNDTYSTFYKEGLKLKNNESFRKCPKCFKPAKADEVQERACCVAIMCKFDFCIKCLRPFHGSKACNSAFAKKTKTDGSVGSRSSKKNLRRL